MKFTLLSKITNHFALNSFFFVVDCQMSDVIGGENLKKQAWFHGYIPRDEAEQLMKRNGDFLVRETMNSTEQDRYVISSFRNGPVHFKVFPATIVVSEKIVVFHMLARFFYNEIITKYCRYLSHEIEIPLLLVFRFVSNRGKMESQAPDFGSNF